jgi:hypothetical protein
VLYRSLDAIHDAAIAMLTAAGAPADRLIGPAAAIWNAGPVFPRPVERGGDLRLATKIVVSTADQEIAKFLARAKPEEMRSRRTATAEVIDLGGWRMERDDLPAGLPGVGGMSACFGSPVVISRKGDRSKGRWHNDVREVDISSAVNARLSRLVGRPVSLRVLPDDEYIAMRKSHAVYSKVKADSGDGHVVGMSFGFALMGSREDLELAWHAGLGEKSRMGFGIVAAA